MNVFEEETRIKLNRSEVFIAHGDQADATNKRYLLLRKFLRSGFFTNFNAEFRFLFVGSSLD